MLVLSKLTNINHANGGSYDPPLFYIPPCSPHGGGFGGASPHSGGFGGLPRTAFSAAAVHSAWGGQFFRCFSHTRPAHGKSIRKNFAGYIAVFHIA